jgi:hypothetical protein
MVHREFPENGSANGPDKVQDQFGCEFKRRLWVSGIVAGIVAGSASGLVGEGVYGWFDPNIGPASIHAPAAQQSGRVALIEGLEINRVALAMGIGGGLTAFSLGLAGGLAARSIRSALLTSLGGLILGAFTAVAGSYSIMPYYIRNRNFFGESFLAPLLLHAALWLPIGATGGLALGSSLGGWRRTARTIAGGLFGAALGTLLTEFMTYALFPLSNASLPLSDSGIVRMTAPLVIVLSGAMFALASLRTVASGEVGDSPSARTISS